MENKRYPREIYSK